MSQIERLLEIMSTLRSEEGCPWDREQTLESLKPYAVEEVYEVLDAIDRGNVEDHCDELGDLLLQVVFHAQLRKETGEFTFEDVAKSISDKMVRRHPHVFGEVEVADSAEVLKNWEEIKAGEKPVEKGGELPSALDGVPLHLPALLRAHELQKNAAKPGFDWPDISGVLDKVREEIRELEDAVASGNQEHAREELGDLLFALANVGRHLNCTSEQALQDANRKFSDRFRRMEQLILEEKLTMTDLTLGELETFWVRIKGD